MRCWNRYARSFPCDVNVGEVQDVNLVGLLSSCQLVTEKIRQIDRSNSSQAISVTSPVPHVPFRSIPDCGGALGNAKESRGSIQLSAQRPRLIESRDSKCGSVTIGMRSRPSIRPPVRGFHMLLPNAIAPALAPPIETPRSWALAIACQVASRAVSRPTRLDRRGQIDQRSRINCGTTAESSAGEHPRHGCLGLRANLFEPLNPWRAAISGYSRAAAVGTMMTRASAPPAATTNRRSPISDPR